MRKFLIGLAIVIALLVGAVLVVPSFVDWNAYKGQLAAQVESSTGRRLAIDGDLSLSLLPTPRLSAAGVRLGNVEGAAGPDMIRLDTARIRVALGPLTQGRVEIETVELIEPRIELERLADGTTNWTFTTPTGGHQPGASAVDSGDFSLPEIKFNDIRIRDGTLIYRDLGAGIIEHVERVNATVAAGSLEGPFRAEGNLTARGVLLDLRLAIGRLAEDRAVPVSVVTGLGEDGAELEFTGVLSGFPNESRLSGGVALRSEDAGGVLGALAGVSELALLAGQPAVIEGELTASSEAVSVNDLRLQLGDASATGAVDLDLAAPPHANVVLNVGQVDLDRLFTATEEAGAPETAQSEPPAEVVPGQRLKPRFALPTGVTGTVEAKVEALVLNGGIVRQAQLGAELREGELVVTQAAAQLPGGSDISMFGRIAPADSDLAFDGQLEASSDNFRALLEWLTIDVRDVPSDRLRKFEVAAKVKLSPEELTVSGVDMQVDVSRIRGGVAVALRRRLGLGVGFSIDKVNLDAYLPRAPAAEPADTADSITDGPEAPEDPPPPAAPLLSSLALLDRFDAILQLQIGNLTFNGAPVNGIAFDGTLQGGVLDLRQASVADFAGAGVSIRGNIAEVGARPRLGLDVGIDASDASRLLEVVGVALPVTVKAVTLEGKVEGDLDELSISSKLSALGGEVKAVGTIAALDTNPRYEMRLDVGHPSFRDLVAGLTNLPTAAGDPGRLSLNGNLAGDVNSAEIQIGTRLGDGSLTLKGMLADLLTGPSGDLTLDIRHPSLTTLARTFRPDYRPALSELGEFRLSTQARFDPTSTKLTGVNGAVGPVALQGEAELTYGGERPRLTASLATSEIIVEWFLAPFAAAKPVPAGEQAPRAPPSRSTRAQLSREDRRWSTEPIDFSVLQGIDAEVTLTAPAVSMASYGVDDPDIQLSLEDGSLNLRRFSGALFGGTLSLTGQIAATTNLILSVADADAVQMIEAARGGRGQDGGAVAGVLGLLFPIASVDLKSGTLGADLAVSTSGGTELELVSNLTGSGEVSFANAVVDGTDLCGMSNQLDNLNGIESLLGLLAAGQGGQTVLDDFAGRFTLESGIATVPQQQIVSSCAVAAFDGTVDLPRWLVDMRANLAFPQHDDFPGIELEEKGDLDAPNARLVNVNAIQEYLIARAATNVIRRLAPTPEGLPAPPTDAAPAEPEAPQTEAPTSERPPKRVDPFKSLLDTLTR